MTSRLRRLQNDTENAPTDAKVVPVRDGRANAGEPGESFSMI